MTTETELDAFETAVAAARAEVGEATPTDSPDAEPADGSKAEVLVDQADEEATEQDQSPLEPPAGEVGEDTEDELFADLDEPGVEGTEPPTPDLHHLPGIDEPVSTEELKNGYLRQADYTRKTQEVAAQRKANEKAIALWEALAARPKDLVRQLAVEAGLLAADAQPVRVVEFAPFKTEADVQAEIDRRVDEALAQHPAIREAEKVIGTRWIEQEFARIEREYDQTLGPKSRELILKTAHAKGVDDLEMVFQALLAKQQEQARQREALKAAAPAKPSGSASREAVLTPPSSFDEAFGQARAELGI